MTSRFINYTPRTFIRQVRQTLYNKCKDSDRQTKNTIKHDFFQSVPTHESVEIKK